jgi:hypothetical protein
MRDAGCLIKTSGSKPPGPVNPKPLPKPEPIDPRVSPVSLSEGGKPRDPIIIIETPRPPGPPDPESWVFQA